MLKTRDFSARASVATVTAFCLFLSPLAPLVGASGAPGPQTAPAAQTKPAVAAGLSPTDPILTWPKSFTTSSGAALIVYEPQIAGWENQARLEALAAVSYTPKGGKQALGTMRAASTTRVSLAERLVDLSAFSIAEVNFPTLPKESLQEVIKEITAAMTPRERVLALDFVLASVDKSTIKPRNTEGLKADPPKVFYSTRPAVVVNIDGDPIWSPIDGNDLRYAVNTNWDLFEHPPTKTFYLRQDSVWFKATALAGPWGPAGTLPPSFSKLPADENFKDVRAAVPGKKAGTSTPTVFVSTTPAELILLTGEPAYGVITGTSLMWVSNAGEADLFRAGRTGPVYFLVSGRWFSAPDFTGPWTFATPNLPADFAKIPLEHPRSRVLASVPGTDQAAEAIMLAQVPQTARVEKKNVQAPQVVYQGTPEFVAIEKTTVSRAVNTDKDILKVGDLYYMCFQGVWFMSRTPTGPWEVTGTVPKAIYEIPPSSPSYNVTYVTVVEDNSDAVVFATALAFTGMMVAWGCVVWGTGYYHPPYVWYGGHYPVYYPHYPTYGYGAHYNPWTGSYSRGAVAYGPYGGAGMGARYNPGTGTYARGAVAYGPYGARGAAEAYNPRTGAYGQTRQGSNVYGSWGTTAVTRGDQWATTSRSTSNITGNTTRTTQTSGGGQAVTKTGPSGSAGVAKTGSGDVYAGKDGNVYKKSGDSWQQYGSSGWSNVDSSAARTSAQTAQTGQAKTGGATATSTGGQPRTGATSTATSPTMSQLNRDAQARSEGAQRTKDLSSVRSGATSASRTGSYRPTGGASRGGRGR